MLRSASVLILASALGCGAPKGATSGAGAGSDTTGCEPGRCVADFSNLIGDHRAEARACYDNARKRVPTLAGTIVVNFVIDQAGAVVEARQGLQDDQISDPEAVVCVVEFVEHLKFAKSTRRQTTRGYHRFQFSPK